VIDLTIVFAFLLAIAAGQVPAAAQPPQQPPVAQPPGTPAAPPAAVPSSRKFTTDAGLMFSVIKPDKTADFEMVMAKVKDALGKSQDPKRKQQALSWRVFKGQETAPGGGIVYVWFIDPPVKDVDYTVTLLDHLSSVLCLDRRRVFATGMSDGGAMSGALAACPGNLFTPLAARVRRRTLWCW